MNYIEQFMKDNGLTVGTYFKIDEDAADYVFDSHFKLWAKLPGGATVTAPTALSALLTGTWCPITKMKQVAKILGVKLNEEFNINKDGMGIPNGPFRLTELGLQGEYEVIFPTYFMKLLTGRY